MYHFFNNLLNNDNDNNKSDTGNVQNQSGFELTPSLSYPKSFDSSYNIEKIQDLYVRALDQKQRLLSFLYIVQKRFCVIYFSTIHS